MPNFTEQEKYKTPCANKTSSNHRLESAGLDALEELFLRCLEWAEKIAMRALTAKEIFERQLYIESVTEN